MPSNSSSSSSNSSGNISGGGSGGGGGSGSNSGGSNSAGPPGAGSNTSLKVLEAYTRDVGRGIARIDYDTMDSLTVS
ncbi:MAG TPA: hypothetical protein VEW92_03595, partial [Nitrososphaeraceae archaeon]|nr:hypothetical protein [Nitrososphaeraceae archaeon]